MTQENPAIKIKHKTNNWQLHWQHTKHVNRDEATNRQREREEQKKNSKTKTLEQ